MQDAPATTTQAPVAIAPAPCPVADTMRRVHAQLQAGDVPSFEALLADTRSVRA